MGAGAVTMLPETGSSAEMMIIALAAAVAVGGAFAIRVFWRRGKNIGD
jgi:LPXTG-motif cell wall-anchored protein